MHEVSTCSATLLAAEVISYGWYSVPIETAVRLKKGDGKQ